MRRIAKLILYGEVVFMDLLMIFIIVPLAVYILYLVIKSAIKNGINESILVSDEQREAYRQKEEENERRRNTLTLPAKINKTMKASDHEKIK